jgi:hypothetical protein
MRTGEPGLEAPRYGFGSRDVRGWYSVTVDGRPAGHVYLRRRTSWALGLGDETRTDHTTRAAAAARLVGMVDSRARAARELGRRMRIRTEAPEGWMVSTWADVGKGSIVRTPGRCRPVESDRPDGLLYPDYWSDPVRLTSVEHMPNGCVFARGVEGGRPAWLGMGHLLVIPRYVEVGVLVPRDGCAVVES